MARRVALNLGQRTAQANRGRGNFAGRGRGRGKAKNPTREELNDSAKTPTFPQENQLEDEIAATTKIRNQPTNRELEIVNGEKETASKQNTEKISDSTTKEKPSKGTKRARESDAEDEGNESTTDVARIMGFGDFNTTKNKHVKGTDCYGISFKQKTEYRQYMNREGGFNRSLSPTRGDRKRIKLSLKKK